MGILNITILGLSLALNLFFRKWFKINDLKLITIIAGFSILQQYFLIHNIICIMFYITILKNRFNSYTLQ